MTFKKTHYKTHKFQAMGGEFALLSYDHKSNISSIFEAVEDEVKRIEAKFTDFKKSDFNLINDYAGIKPVEIDDEIYNLIKKSLEVSDVTDGIFDISFASVGHKWRDYKSRGESLPTELVDYYKKLINYKEIQINEKERTVFLPHKDMRIGLGGIGKGYAVDKAYELLKQNNITNFFINGSGDIRVESAKDAPRKWRVGIQNPFDSTHKKIAGVLQLSKGAMASSGGYIHHVKNKKNTDHHIINPDSGKSNPEIIASTVVAQDTITADTTATVLINMDQAQAINYLNDFSMFGVLVDKNGKTHLSKRALANFSI